MTPRFSIRTGLLVFIGLGVALAISQAVWNWWNTPTHRDRNKIRLAISPDDLTIAFTAKGRGGQDVYLLDLDKYEVSRLTDSTSYESNPRFSPDGQSIVFSRGRRGELADHIAVLSANGTNLRQLTNDQANDSQPAFSNDGKLIAFVRDFKYSRSNSWRSNWDYGGIICVANCDGTGFKQMTSGSKAGYSPFFSRDNSSIIFLMFDGMYSVPISGNEQPTKIRKLSNVSSPSIASNRTSMVFASGKTLFKSNFETSNTEPKERDRAILTNKFGGYEHLVISNSGKVVYYVDWTTRELWRINIDGSNPVRIASHELFREPMTWKPDPTADQD